MRSRISHQLAILFQTLNPNYLSFVAGVVVSAAINIYTGVLLSDMLSRPAEPVIVSSILLLISSFFLTSLSLSLQSLRELAITQAPEFLSTSEQHAIHLRLISGRLSRLIKLLSVSVITSGVGLLLLAIR